MTKRTKMALDNPDDYASEKDRVWFEQHPTATSYTRLAFPGEIGGGVSMVRVIQIERGVRVRQPLDGQESEC